MSDLYEPTEAEKRELWGLMCGELIGCGSARRVFAHSFDPHLVIKVEGTSGSFQNVSEWQAWQAVQHTEHAKWFAPCVAISPCGVVLVQRRTTRAANHPERVPAFFADRKLDNFGMLTPREGEEPGQFVSHDYGLHMLLEYGMTKRMVKANWWNL